MKLTVAQEEAVEAMRSLGGEAEVWWQTDPRSRVSAHPAGGTGRNAVSMQRKTLESLIGKKLIEITDAPASRNGWRVWRLTATANPVAVAETLGETAEQLDRANAVAIGRAEAYEEAHREEVADSAWNLTDLGQWAIDRAEALRRAKQIAEYMVRTGQWAAPGTVFFGPYDTSGIRRNRAGQIVGYIRGDGSEASVPEDPPAP